MEQLIVDAAEIGLRGEEFWNLSPYEMRLQFQGAAQRMNTWRSIGLFVAWHAALFQRSEKLPPLEPLLKHYREAAGPRRQTEPAPRQTWQEQKAIMAAMRGLIAKAPEKTKAAPARKRRGGARLG